jgi:hypothetical protein
VCPLLRVSAIDKDRISTPGCGSTDDQGRLLPTGHLRVLRAETGFITVILSFVDYLTKVRTANRTLSISQLSAYWQSTTDQTSLKSDLASTCPSTALKGQAAGPRRRVILASIDIRSAVAQDLRVNTVVCETSFATIPIHKPIRYTRLPYDRMLLRPTRKSVQLRTHLSPSSNGQTILRDLRPIISLYTRFCQRA